METDGDDKSDRDGFAEISYEQGMIVEDNSTSFDGDDSTLDSRRGLGLCMKEDKTFDGAI